MMIRLIGEYWWEQLKWHPLSCLKGLWAMIGPWKIFQLRPCWRRNPRVRTHRKARGWYRYLRQSGSPRDIDLYGGVDILWLWTTGVSLEGRPGGDLEYYATVGGGWLWNLFIIKDIIWARFLSSLFISLNSATETVDCLASWFSILV